MLNVATWLRQTANDVRGQPSTGGAQLSIEAFDGTLGSRGAGRLFLCARCHVQVVICRLRPRPNLLCSWMRSRSSRGGAMGGWPALSSERPRSCNPRLAVPSLSSSTERRDASWFTTCVCNGLDGRTSLSWRREHTASIGTGLSRLRRPLFPVWSKYANGRSDRQLSHSRVASSPIIRYHFVGIEGAHFADRWAEMGRHPGLRHRNCRPGIPSDAWRYRPSTLSEGARRGGGCC
jgi:hypothetical protein